MEFTTFDDEIPGPSIACSGAFDENCPELTPSFRLGNGLWPWHGCRKNVLFLRWRGERYILHRATGFPYISPISSVLRWREKRYILKNVFFLREEVLILEFTTLDDAHTSPSHRISIYFSPISSVLRWREKRYIPKNVFFLREEVLIYDAPESATFPRMFFASADQKSPEEAMP